MFSLYLNTVTPHTTIALFKGSEVVTEKRWKSQLNEAETLQPAVEELLESQQLRPEDIQQVIVCVGPGGFTSSRIGVSAANAWSLAKRIPISEVSVFDLYEARGVVLVLSANANEAWIKMPGKDPQFLSVDQLQLPTSFQFGGIVQDAWKEALMKLGGTFLNLEERLPNLENLHFEHKIVKPWYYKDANITWSTRVHGKK